MYVFSQEGSAMLKLIYSAVVAASLVALPMSAQTQEQPKTSKSTAKSKATTTKASTSKREPTAGQLAARERQKQCGTEWKEAKAAGKTKGTTWPKYWSACNTRLKAKGT
jgi:type IV secretory pathway VirB10-like protein